QPLLPSRPVRRAHPDQADRRSQSLPARRVVRAVPPRTSSVSLGASTWSTRGDRRRRRPAQGRTGRPCCLHSASKTACSR
ncbi:hypothetical protein PMAYCL1PPCAC_09190, partial [Pristionchus mayeri]